MRGSDGRRVPGFCDTNAAKRVWVALMCTLAALTSLLMAYFIMFPVRGQLLPDDARLLKFAYSEPGSGGSVLQLDFEVRWAVQQKGCNSQSLTLCNYMCVPISSCGLGSQVPVLVENRNVFSEAEMTHAEASVAYRGFPLLWGQVNLTYVPASSVAKVRNPSCACVQAEGISRPCHAPAAHRHACHRLPPCVSRDAAHHPGPLLQRHLS